MLERLRALTEWLAVERDAALEDQPDTYMQPLPITYGCARRLKFFTDAATPNYDFLKDIL